MLIRVISREMLSSVLARTLSRGLRFRTTSTGRTPTYILTLDLKLGLLVICERPPLPSRLHVVMTEELYVFLVPSRSLDNRFLWHLGCLLVLGRNLRRFFQIIGLTHRASIRLKQIFSILLL